MIADAAKVGGVVFAAAILQASVFSEISILNGTPDLLLVTLLHRDDFDFRKLQTRVWFGAYLAYPLIE